MDQCIHFPDCGGCCYQDIPYSEQLAKKEREIADIIGQGETPDPGLFEGILHAADPYGYRNKMEYTFGDAFKDGPLALGMHKRKSRFDIVTADSCNIVHPDFNRILKATLDYFSERKIRFYHKFRHDGTLRHLLVRRGKNTGEILVSLVTASEGMTDEILNGWKDCLLKLDTQQKIVGILHTRNDSPADAVIDQGTDILYGQDFFTEKLMGLTFRITPFSFFQNNSDGAEILYGKVREYIGDVRGKTVFDLYSGTGTIAQIAAASSRETFGVELVPEAVKAAEENAGQNGMGNCRFLCGDVLKVLEELKEKPDVIIMDPPREGVHPKALGRILSYGVEHMIYVSCKPQNFGKELPSFFQNGYRIRKSCAVDMFPFTKNTEMITLLEKENAV